MAEGGCARSRRSVLLHAALGSAATLTMALLAFDRYCAIVRQPRRALGRRRAAQLLGAAWLAALGLAGPCCLLAAREEAEEATDRGAPGPAGPHCWHAPPWGSPSRLGPPYGAAWVVLCFVLPCALMCFCHFHICRAVRSAESRVRPLSGPGQLLRLRGETRTATTVLLMVVSLVCCWAPYCALGLAAAAGHASPSPALDAAASWAAWADGALNPLIYAVRNPDLALLLRRNRQGGYRSGRDVAAYQAAARGRHRRPEAKSRAERYARRGPLGPSGGALSSPGPAAGGGEVALWAWKNPALLFCRDGQTDAASDLGAQLRWDTVDTSL